MGLFKFASLSRPEFFIRAANAFFKVCSNFYTLLSWLFLRLWGTHSKWVHKLQELQLRNGSECHELQVMKMEAVLSLKWIWVTKLTVPEQKNVLQSNDEDVSTPSISTSQRKKKATWNFILCSWNFACGKNSHCAYKRYFPKYGSNLFCAQKLPMYSSWCINFVYCLGPG